MTVDTRPELLTSLAAVQQDVERYTLGLDRYRALIVIEKTISDFSGLEDVASPLAMLRDEVRRRLEATPEYRALAAVKKIVPELTEVLAFLADRAGMPASSEAGDGRQARHDDGGSDSAGETTSTAPDRDLAEDLPAVGRAPDRLAAYEDPGSASGALPPVADPAPAVAQQPASVAGFEIPASETEPGLHAEAIPQADGSAGSSLAYSLAQMVVQGRSLPQREPASHEAEPDRDPGEPGEDSAPQAEKAA